MPADCINGSQEGLWAARGTHQALHCITLLFGSCKPATAHVCMSVCVNRQHRAQDKLLCRIRPQNAARDSTARKPPEWDCTLDIPYCHLPRHPRQHQSPSHCRPEEASERASRPPCTRHSSSPAGAEHRGSLVGRPAHPCSPTACCRQHTTHSMRQHGSVLWTENADFKVV